MMPGFGAGAADLLAIDGVLLADVTASIANDAAKLPAGSAIILDGSRPNRVLHALRGTCLAWHPGAVITAAVVYRAAGDRLRTQASRNA